MFPQSLHCWCFRLDKSLLQGRGRWWGRGCSVHCRLFSSNLASTLWKSAASPLPRSLSDIFEGQGVVSKVPWLRTTVFHIVNIQATQFYLIVKITRTPCGLNTNVSFQLLILYSKFEPNQTYYNTYNVGGVVKRYITCPKTSIW